MNRGDLNPFASPPLAVSPPAEPVPLPENGNWPLKPTEIAEIVEVRPPHRQMVLRPWNFVIAVSSRYWSLAPSLIVLVILIPPSTHLMDQVLIWTMVAGILFSVVLSHLFLPFRFLDTHLSKKLAASIRRRPDSIVPRPNSPLAQYVAIVPQEFWHLKLSHWPIDVAYLKVDPVAQAILLEGDQRRHHIPYGSLFDCQPMAFKRHTLQIWLIRLVFQTQAGPQELYLRPGDVEWFRTQSNRRRRELAEAAHLRIMQLTPLQAKAVPSARRRDKYASPGWGMDGQSIGPEG